MATMTKERARVLLQQAASGNKVPIKELLEAIRILGTQWAVEAENSDE